MGVTPPDDGRRTALHTQLCAHPEITGRYYPPLSKAAIHGLHCDQIFDCNKSIVTIDIDQASIVELSKMPFTITAVLRRDVNCLQVVEPFRITARFYR